MGIFDFTEFEGNRFLLWKTGALNKTLIAFKHYKLSQILYNSIEKLLANNNCSGDVSTRAVS